VESRWQEQASCATADPAAWYPVMGSIPAEQVTRVCAGCPVQRSCLAVALLCNEHGIWAGTNPRQRHEG
jgi:WhiB family redox-sensing transcriptional regulator